MKHLIKVIVYSFLCFCTCSYLSVMYSLLGSVFYPSKPVTNLGFPLKYYYQFWLNGSDSPNCGWIISNFVIDVIITLVIVSMVYYLYCNRRTNKIS